jgi:site-specific DNA recombinase
MARQPCKSPSSELYATPQIPAEELAAIREDLRAYLSRDTEQRKREAERQRRRLARLEDERHKLLRAHLADAVPLDLLKAEQDRISREISQAQTLLARAEADYCEVMDTFDQAANLANLDEATYWSLPPLSRRLVNQTVFSAHPSPPGP